MHCAVDSGCINLARFLIETANANVEACDSNGCTVLHQVGKNSSSSDLEFLMYLVGHCPADLVNAIDNKGLTALHHACSSKRNVEMVRCLIETCHANIDDTDSERWTILHHASSSGSSDTVLYLLENCHPNVEAINGLGRTALHLASSSNDLERSEP